MVGDKYSLSGTLRTILQRGVWSEMYNHNRQDRIIKDIGNQELIIDGYNIVFTFLNYKMGHSVFISTDNLCRDAGSLFGKIRKQEFFQQSLKQIIEFISILKPFYVQIYYDIPVSFSINHKNITEKFLEEMDLLGTVYLVKSADKEIMKMEEGVICTSDSNIIDNTQNPIADLARAVINHFYNPDLLNLNLLLKGLY